MEPSLPPEPPAGQTSYRKTFVAAAVLAGGVVFALWTIWRWQDSTKPPPDDPLSSFHSPYLNVRPGVQYVGDKVCADCHDEAKTYKHHPMGQSAAPVARATPRESSVKDTVSVFEALGSRFEVFRK